ncbi:MAG: hypothetical protein AB7S26_03560 [Sandaracinaceae bacterium]
MSRASVLRWMSVIVVGATPWMAPGCDAGGTSPRRDGGTGATETGDTACSDSADNDGDGLTDCSDPDCYGTGPCGTFDAGARPDSGFNSCIGTPYQAEEAFAPVDIIWVVDTSGSMSDEAMRVQENMQNFATAIGAVGIDWHVVMISTQDFVNVPASLASDARYRLIDRAVNSNEPLQALLTEFPRYQDFLRASALTHFVAVTDDDSSLGWMEFKTQMRANLRHNFIFHTISSPDTPGGLDGACSNGGGFPPDGAAAAGREYYAIAADTGGLALSICTPSSEWTNLFGLLTSVIAVPISIPCEYDIPPPPPGETLDFGRVNIRYTPGSGASRVFPFVGGPRGNDCTTGGWYYDDDASPTRIILCPTTCNEITGDGTGRVDVELGCATFII